jgi:hypothetical protein
MFDPLQDASQALARTEVELRHAQVTLTEAVCDRSAIAERIAAKNAAITEARRIHAERTLTEQEAAQFNLDLLDLKDLKGLLSAANGPVAAAQAKVNAAQTNVSQRRAYLDHVANELRLKRLVANVMELEATLCAALQETFDAARSMGQRSSMRDLWKPSQALEHSVRQNRAPNGAL